MILGLLLTCCFLFASLIAYHLSPWPWLFPSFQKLCTGHSAWTLRHWRRRCAGAPRKTYLGRRRVTLTSLLHFMTLLQVETTHLASLKVNNGVVLCVFPLCLTQMLCYVDECLRIFCCFCLRIASEPKIRKFSIIITRFCEVLVQWNKTCSVCSVQRLSATPSTLDVFGNRADLFP